VGWCAIAYEGVRDSEWRGRDWVRNWTGGVGGEWYIHEQNRGIPAYWDAKANKFVKQVGFRFFVVECVRFFLNWETPTPPSLSSSPKLGIHSNERCSMKLAV
jgi:hypothetical protein